MDLIFEQFEKWFKEREPIWNKNSITIEKIHLETEYGHHYSMNLKCDNGLGNIVLYESNGIYWFMLEAGNYGSITKLMGFRIPHIINSAHINEF